ncbi:hypothetical protein ScPMuIL_012699 [Solemya velum]
MILPPAGDYVATNYLDEWYIGRVLEFDKEDEDVNISFMNDVTSKQRKQYRWSQPPDEQWVSLRGIIMKIPASAPDFSIELHFCKSRKKMLNKIPKKGKIYDTLHRTIVSGLMGITAIGTVFLGYHIYSYLTVIRPIQMEKLRREKEDELALEQLESEKELLSKQRDAETLIS